MLYSVVWTFGIQSLVRLVHLQWFILSLRCSVLVAQFQYSKDWCRVCVTQAIHLSDGLGVRLRMGRGRQTVLWDLGPYIKIYLNKYCLMVWLMVYIYHQTLHEIPHSRKNTFRAHWHFCSFVNGWGTKWTWQFVLGSGARVKTMCQSNVYCNRYSWLRRHVNGSCPPNIIHLYARGHLVFLSETQIFRGISRSLKLTGRRD